MSRKGRQMAFLNRKSGPGWADGSIFEKSKKLALIFSIFIECWENLIR
jgi:hypothetical protein